MKRLSVVLLALLASCKDVSAPSDDDAPISVGPASHHDAVERNMRTKPMMVGTILTRDSDGRLMSEESGGGQVVHPSFLPSSKDWKTSWGLMALAPYPWSNGNYENPSMYVLKDSVTLVEAKGVHNPLMRTPSVRINSDVNIVLDRADRSVFLTNREAGADSNIVTSLVTTDGLSYSSRYPVVGVGSHAIVSQSITYGADGVPRMYSINAGPLGCSTKTSWMELRLPTNFVTGTKLQDVAWGEPVKINLVQPGFVVWHGEVQWVESLHLYVSLVAAYPELSSGCSNDDLFLAISVDGINFTTYSDPLLWRQNPWLQVGSLYKSTFYYDAGKDLLRIWSSLLTLPGAKLAGGKWRLWYASFGWSGLRSDLTKGTASSGFQSLRYRRMLWPDPLREKLQRGVIMP